MPDWKKQLQAILERGRKPADRRRPGKADVVRYVQEVAVPALEEVAAEMERHGRRTALDVREDRAELTVFDGDEEEFSFAVRARTYRKPSFAFPEMRFNDDEASYHRAEVYLNGEAQGYGVMGYTKEQVIRLFLHEYDKCIRWQRPTRGRAG